MTIRRSLAGNHASGTHQASLGGAARPTRRVFGVGAAVSLAAFGARCARPLERQLHERNGELLYVANGLDGTISRLDTASGRAIGRPLLARPGPVTMVVGSRDGILLHAPSAGPRDALTLLIHRGTGWSARPVQLEPSTHSLVVTGGGRHAAVVYRASVAASGGPVSPCRLAVIDLATGSLERAHVRCDGRDVVLAVALSNLVERVTAATRQARARMLGFDAAGATSTPGRTATPRSASPVAYVGVWRAGGEAVAQSNWDESRRAARGRILAVQARSGAIAGTLDLDGAPIHVSFAPGPGGAAPRLYAVDAVPSDGDRDLLSPDESSWVPAYSEWRLVVIDPVTLRPEDVIRLPESPRALTIAPDGDHAYWLEAVRGAGASTAVMHTDLATGVTRRLARVRGSGLGGMAVTADSVFVPNSEGAEIAVVDRRSGLLVRSLPTGPRPLGIALSSDDLNFPHRAGQRAAS